VPSSADTPRRRRKEAMFEAFTAVLTNACSEAGRPNSLAYDMVSMGIGEVATTASTGAAAAGSHSRAAAAAASPQA
jgi:hypothetical protein